MLFSTFTFTRRTNAQFKSTDTQRDCCRVRSPQHHRHHHQQQQEQRVVYTVQRANYEPLQRRRTAGLRNVS